MLNAVSAHPAVRIVGASNARADIHIRAAWENLVDENSGSTLFFQSPEYFDHLTDQRPGSTFLGVVENDFHSPIGIVPMCRSQVALKFELGGRCFGQISFAGVQILGGALLTPQSSQVFDQILHQIDNSFPKCKALEISGVSTASPLWHFVKDSRKLKQDFILYAPYGPRMCHTADVNNSYQDYLRKFGHKKSYNLRRQVRRLDRFGQGSLRLRRIDTVPDIEFFREAWGALSCHSKRANGDIPRDELADIAKRRLLLSYVLSIKGSPCGAVFGTRFRETLLVHGLRHDDRMNRLSPGTVLHTLMMKDLIENKLARRIDYGFGEPKYRLHNNLDERVHVILIRKTTVNRALKAAHMSYVEVVDLVKRLVARS